MIVRRLMPILNVSDIQESFSWFEKLGWSESWHWGEPPTFASVRSFHFEIFLCQHCQGGRMPRPLPQVEPFDSSEANNRGVWISIFVDDVDEVHRRCVDRGIEITMAPNDREWGVREMHVRHPDGHTFRIGSPAKDEE
jgi:uncharacterized glyoxalase superfamily protein PhnB